eukprot:369872_1
MATIAEKVATLSAAFTNANLEATRQNNPENQLNTAFADTPHDQISKAQSHLESISMQMRKTQSELADISEMYSQSQRQCVDLATENAKLSDELAGLSAGHRSLKEDVTMAHGDNEATKQRLSETTDQLKVARDDNETIRQRLNQIED